MKDASVVLFVVHACWAHYSLQNDYPYGSLWNLSLYIFVRKWDLDSSQILLQYNPLQKEPPWQATHVPSSRSRYHPSTLARQLLPQGLEESGWTTEAPWLAKDTCLWSPDITFAILQIWAQTLIHSKSLANKTWDPIQCYPNGAKVCKSLNISIFSKLNSIFWHSKTFQTRAGSLQKGYPLYQSYKKIKNACPWKPFHPFKSWFIRRISQSMPFGFPKKTRNAQFSHRDPSPPSQQLPTRFIQTFVRSDLADDSGRPPLSACLPGISKICHSNWNN